MPNHPYKQKLVIAVILLLGVILVMRYQGAALIMPDTPTGILALEFANTSEKLSLILSVWPMDAAKLNIWLDFIFIIVYTRFFLLTLSIAVNQWQHKIPTRIGKWLIVSAWIAAVFDVAENIIMLASLARHYTELSLQATAYFASIKFLIVLLMLLYLLVSLLANLFSPKTKYGN